MKKYEFTGETKETGTCIKITLRRIKAVVDFGDVKAGELGGWIEKEENLSNEGNAWVCDNARVYDNADLYDTGHVLVIGPIGSRNDFTAFYRDRDNEIMVNAAASQEKTTGFI